MYPHSKDILTCDKCSLCETRLNVVLPKLSPLTEILFIMESPGEAEDSSGILLSGDSGTLFIDFLARVGISSDDNRIGFTSVTKCWPKETNEVKIQAGKKHRPLKLTEIKACSSYLDFEIKQLLKLKLKLIVCVGAVAVKRILGHSGSSIESLQGKFFTSQEYGKVFVIPHPSRILYLSPVFRTNFQTQFLQQLKIIKGVLDGVYVNKEESRDVKYRFITNIKQAEWLFSQLNSAKLYTFDIESTSLDFLESKILCIAFCWKPGEAYTLPLEGNEFSWGENYTYIFQNLKKTLANPAVKKVAHNAKFDLLHLRANNLPVSNLYADTMLMHYCLNENEEHGLKALSWSYTNLGGYENELDKLRTEIAKERKVPLKNISFTEIPDTSLWWYNAADTDVTLRLYIIFYKQLVQEGLWDFYQEYYVPMISFLEDVETRGVSIDVEYLDKMLAIYQQKIAEIDKSIQQDISVRNYINEKKRQYKDIRRLKYENTPAAQKKYTLEEYINIGINEITFNSNSPKQLAELLYDKLKLPVIKRTDKNSPSTSADVLETYAKKVPVAKLLVQKNKLSHLSSTFLEGMKARLKSDNKIHTSFNLHVTVTARLSSTNPNLQNLPNKTNNPSDAKLIRNIFTGDPNCVLVECDYGQAEFRMWGQISNDQAMYEDLLQGVDIHKKFASIVYRIPEVEVTKDQRNMVKAVVFGTIYGRTPESVSDQLGISVKEAKEIQNQLFKRYPQAAMWLKSSKVVAKRDGYVLGLFGQKRRLANEISSINASVRAEAERQAMNSPLQGSASQMTCYAGMKIANAFKEKLPHPESGVIMLIHDAIVMNVHKDSILYYDALNIIEDCMLHPHPKVTFPLKIDFKVSKKWGDGEEMSKEEILTYVKNNYDII